MLITPTVALPPATPFTDHVTSPPPGAAAANCGVRDSVMAAILGDTVTVPSEMVTVATAGWLVPPAPAQVNTKAVVAVTGPVLWLPLETDPLQPPDAVQDIALIEVHVSVGAPPVTTEGLAGSRRELWYVGRLRMTIVIPAGRRYRTTARFFARFVRAQSL